MTTTAAPAIDSVVQAQTCTTTAQAVTIQVSGIAQETAAGWYVYGYRVGRSATRRNRQTAYPSRYFIRRGSDA